MRPLISVLLLIVGIVIGMGIEPLGRQEPTPAPSETPRTGAETEVGGREDR
ncbi:MAG: hypothetical protein M3461_04555 [Pseudomonadota bacterium]|nr:hypothetical protein [Pseudomonadota bacterium]